MKKLHLKQLAIPAVVVALVAAGGGYAWYRKSHSNTTPLEPGQTVTEQTTPTPDNSASPENDQDIKVKRRDPSDPSTPSSHSSSASVEITSTYVSSTRVTVHAVVSGAKSGTCTATFTKSGQKAVTQTASVSIVTSYYECGKLDVAKSRFPVTGTWSVSVKLTTGDTSATSASESITIK